MQEDPIGEIDIIEGINHQRDDIVSVHTGRPCRFYPGWQTGRAQRPRCELFDLEKNASNPYVSHLLTPEFSADILANQRPSLFPPETAAA